MKMRISLLLLFVAAVFVAKSSALECFACDSDHEQNCHNMYDRNVRTENCANDRVVGFQRSVCLKTVTFEYGNRRTIRSCARAGPRKDPCNERRDALDLTVCEVCDHHLCNNSIKLLNSMWSLPIAIILLLKKFF